MNVGGGVAPSVLHTLEFPAALERVAAHAVSALGADRIQDRTPGTDPETIRAALAQVAELAARVISDDSIRAEPVSDIGPTLDLLAVPGSALEGLALSQVGGALAAARLVGTELARLATDAPRVAALRVPPLPKELEVGLQEALDADGTVRDGASRGLARARQAVRETRQRLVAKARGAPIGPRRAGAGAGCRGYCPRRPLRCAGAQHRAQSCRRNHTRRVCDGSNGVRGAAGGGAAWQRAARA